jgi:hypothetical protein
VFNGTMATRSELFARGNLLISMRNINTLAILDGRTREIAWLWGPTNLTFPHHPCLLENGNILVFDNGTDESQVLEVNPLTREVVWRYANGREFFSQTRGSNQRLPNGNTLITESDRGYVLEVTSTGEVVWKFANPDINAEGVRGAIWRMTRFMPSEIDFQTVAP